MKTKYYGEVLDIEDGILEVLVLENEEPQNLKTKIYNYDKGDLKMNDHVQIIYPLGLDGTQGKIYTGEVEIGVKDEYEQIKQIFV